MSAVEGDGLFARHPVIAVYTPMQVDEAVSVARALARGRVHALEVTLRTPIALDAIAAIAAGCPDVLVGAGTVLTADQLDRAAQAGARFAVSPGCTPTLLAAGRRSTAFYVPGVATASEAMLAREAGYRLLKLFPATSAGGRALLRSLRGPLPDLRFCPTGGIAADEVAGYLAEPNVACVGGSWFTPQDAVAGGDFERIESIARATAEVAQRTGN